MVLIPGRLAANEPTSLPTPEALDFFERRIRPVLAEHCYSCHGPDPAQRKGGLRLDTRDGLRRGGHSGPALVPGDSDASLLIEAVRYTNPDLEMPPKGKRLERQQVLDLEAWVTVGAPDPRTSEAPRAASEPYDFAQARAHWAFQPVTQPALPAVEDPAWAQHPIDALVHAQLEARGLSPAPPAHPRTLLRRVTYSLTGLPPTPAETEAFLADPSPAAYARVVERLLASPHYGERWGRYWLDVARYADTKGYVFQEERRFPFAYTYRDYVVRSFNEDLPYDRFLLEQLAADQLEPASDNRPFAALGFLTLGRRFLNNPHDIIDDRIDVTLRGLQGLTVTCARCHDHKFDPIPIADYYSLYGVFASSEEPAERPLLPTAADPQDSAAFLAERQRLATEIEEKTVATIARYLEELRARRTDYEQAATELAADSPPADLETLATARNLVVPMLRRFVEWQRAGAIPADPFDLPRADLERWARVAIATATASLRNQRDALEVTHPGAPARAMVLTDKATPVEPHVFLRGNPGNRGPQVPRRFLEILAGPHRTPFTRGSGRLELAQAIANPSNPLTARVLVNRVWLGHFGQGLVRTPSDFGLRTEPPPHRELLDYLAASFMENGWSLKALHRQILLSRTYQQSGTFDPHPAAVDPANHLAWRSEPRRLDFEALRDTLLAVGGNLDLRVGGRSVDITTDTPSPRRTLYGFIDRQNLPGLFRTFDFASPDATSPQRFTTTVPQQALYLMNHPFVIEQARRLAARALAPPDIAVPCGTGASPASLESPGPGQTHPIRPAFPSIPDLHRLYQLVYQRDATDVELRLATAFLEAESEAPVQSLTSWERLAHVLLQSNELAFLD
jgi:cytochrome c553